MGESFTNIVRSVREKMAKPLYNSSSVSVIRLEDTKEKRPKSQALQKAHPELYDFLLNQVSEKKFNVGIIHLDARGDISKKLVSLRKKPSQIAFKLYAMVRSELVKIALKMKEDPSSDVGKIDFLTGVSRYFLAERAAQRLGFEIFEIDDSERIKFDSSSHGRTRQTYELSQELGIIDQIPDLDKSEAKIGLISRQAILALLEKHSTSK